jgi:hypothetical protein
VVLARVCFAWLAMAAFAEPHLPTALARLHLRLFAESALAEAALAVTALDE